MLDACFRFRVAQCHSYPVGLVVYCFTQRHLVVERQCVQINQISFHLLISPGWISAKMKPSPCNRQFHFESRISVFRKPGWDLSFPNRTEISAWTEIRQVNHPSVDAPDSDPQTGLVFAFPGLAYDQLRWLAEVSRARVRQHSTIAVVMTQAIYFVWIISETFQINALCLLNPNWFMLFCVSL